MKKVLYWLSALLVLVWATEYAGAQSAKTLSPETPGKERGVVRARNYRLSWKGNTLTNRDTSVAMLTGATQKYDTTDAFYNIAGANTLSIQDIWQALEDSALAILYMDVSNDGTSWAPFPVVNDTLGAGVDSSGARVIGTTVRLKAITSVPGAQFVRFRLRKYLSAATDTMKLQSYLFVTFNDE